MKIVLDRTKLKEAREAAGLTQLDLSGKMLCSKQHIQQIENPKSSRTITVRTLERYWEALGVVDPGPFFVPRTD